MSGFSEDMTCPYCEFEGAQRNTENRGEGRGETESCDICGYYSYEPGYEDENYPARLEAPEPSTIPDAKILAWMFELTWQIDDEELEFEDEFRSFLWDGKIEAGLRNGTAYKVFADALIEHKIYKRYLAILMK